MHLIHQHSSLLALLYPIQHRINIESQQKSMENGSGSDAVWYFAFGSMCNPTSLKRRGIIPYESSPAKITGYKLAFQLGGMANVVPDDAATCHGILHHITADMFKKLAKLEATYDVIHVAAVPYQPYTSSSNNTSNRSSTGDATASSTAAAAAAGTCGNPVTATAFIVHQSHLAQMQEQHPDWHISLPSERYITIISSGLTHYGADPAWTEFVAAQPFSPSKQPSEFLRIPVPEDPSSLQTFTLAQLSKYEGKIVENKAVFACGRKVIEIDVSSKPNTPFVVIMKQHMTGKDHVYSTCMNLYDPRLPPLDNGPQDITQQHIDWAEDMVMEWTSKQGFSIKQIGWLQQEQGQGSQQ